MKKSKIKFFPNLMFLGLVLLCLSTNVLFAKMDFAPKDTTGGIRIEKTNWLNSMDCTFDTTFCISLAEDNKLILKMIAQFADPNIGNYPDLHFRYLFYSPTSSIPSVPFGVPGVTPAATPSMVEPTILENGDSAWQVVFLFEFDFDHICTGLTPDIDTFDIRIQYELVTLYSPGLFAFYPVGAYPTLFPPDTFYIPPSGLADVINKDKRICCFGESMPCGGAGTNPFDYSDPFSNQQTQSVKEGIDRSTPESEDTQGVIATMQPNPFSTNVWTHHKVVNPEKHQRLTVLNALGRVVFQQEFLNRPTGDYWFEISTEDWPPGIYYFNTFTGDDNSVSKMIKH